MWSRGGRSQGGRQSGRNMAQPDPSSSTHSLESLGKSVSSLSLYKGAYQWAPSQDGQDLWEPCVEERGCGLGWSVGLVLGDPPGGLPRASSCGLGEPVTRAALLQKGPSDHSVGVGLGYVDSWASPYPELDSEEPRSLVLTGFLQQKAAQACRWGPGSLWAWSSLCPILPWGLQSWLGWASPDLCPSPVRGVSTTGLPTVAGCPVPSPLPSCSPLIPGPCCRFSSPVSSPPDNVDDPTGNFRSGPLTGWRVFLLLLCALLGIVVCAVVGAVVFQKRQERNKRFY